MPFCIRSWCLANIWTAILRIKEKKEKLIVLTDQLIIAENKWTPGYGMGPNTYAILAYWTDQFPKARKKASAGLRLRVTSHLSFLRRQESRAFAGPFYYKAGSALLVNLVNDK